MKTNIKIVGWDFLPSNVQDDVLTYIVHNHLPWHIINDGTRDWFDILIEVDHRGHISWGEAVKVFLATLIYMLLHAAMTRDAGLTGMALSMTPPSGVATPDID